MENPAAKMDDQDVRAAARVGWVLQEKWFLEELLGVGGMAAVYRAVHNNGRYAAIKILHQELSQVEEARERFLEEGYVANRVGHPGTVAVLDDGISPDGAIYLVMELLEGETLEARWVRGRQTLPVLDVLALMAPLLDTLGAAHEQTIIHRDIKPENVFLTCDGDVKLLDFGIARMADSRRTNKTQVGTTIGTPAFMSPEQARGRWEALDARSDLWSVGATMYVLLSGRTPHVADTTNELLLAAMTAKPPPIQDFAPDLPDEVASIVDQAVDPDPARRFQTAEDMRQAVLGAQRRLARERESLGFSSIPPVAGGPIDPDIHAPPPRSTYRPVTTTQPPISVSVPPKTLRPAPAALMALGLAAAVALGVWVIRDNASTDAAPNSAAPNGAAAAEVAAEKQVAPPTDGSPSSRNSPPNRSASESNATGAKLADPATAGTTATETSDDGALNDEPAADAVQNESEPAAPRSGAPRLAPRAAAKPRPPSRVTSPPPVKPTATAPAAESPSSSASDGKPEEFDPLQLRR